VDSDGGALAAAESKAAASDAADSDFEKDSGTKFMRSTIEEAAA
jgi:hypothetical protein